MKNFIQSFLDKTPAAVKKLEDHLHEKDYHALSRSAHSLKPQLSYMGIKSANNLVVTIEESAKNETNIDHLSDLTRDLKQILEKAYSELREKLKEL